MNIKEFDKVFFNKLTEKYDFKNNIPEHIEFYKNKNRSVVIESKGLYNIFWNTELRVIETVLNRYKNSKILEIGCGIGQLSIFLKLNGIDIDACDICSKRVEEFKYFCNIFNTTIDLYQEQYQNLNIDNYDVFLAINIKNSVNNFTKDLVLLEKINNKQKFFLSSRFLTKTHY